MTTETIPKPTLDKRIDQYVRLRDKIKEITDRHKSELKPFRETLEQLNGLILAELEASGSESVRTATGTAYKTLTKSASIADRTVFWEWLVSNDEWDVIDYKANAAVISDRLQAGGMLPPGVNYTETWEVGVRRPATKKD